MSRILYPCTYELIDAIDDRSNPRAYFKYFESRVEAEPDLARVWAAQESQFRLLDWPSWEQLKTEALPYLTVEDPKGRGWHQLISILNQARAHNYLKRRGCTDIRFVPRAKKTGIETPDIEANWKAREILCEVKTLEISDDEVRARSDILGRATQHVLPLEFHAKFCRTIEKAQRQLYSYRKSPESECIAFLVINFDDWPGEYKGDYYRQIDKNINGRNADDCRIVLYNQTTIFHSVIGMANAEVVNEDG